MPLVDHPLESELESVKTYFAFEVPDQLAFGQNGRLYVSLAIANQISLLDVDGNELQRFSNDVTSPIPLDSPAGIAFDNTSKSLLIANHGLFTGNNFAVLKSQVGQTGAELANPVVP